MGIPDLLPTHFSYIFSQDLFYCFFIQLGFFNKNAVGFGSYRLLETLNLAGWQGYCFRAWPIFVLVCKTGYILEQWHFLKIKFYDLLKFFYYYVFRNIYIYHPAVI